MCEISSLFIAKSREVRKENNSVLHLEMRKIYRKK